MVWTLFSAVVGAGYASGRELVLFLGPCGAHQQWAALLVGLLTGLAAALPEPDAPAPGGSPRWLLNGPWLASAIDRVTGWGLAWVTLAAMVAALTHLVARAPEEALATVVAVAGAIWAGAALPLQRGLAFISRLLGPAIAAAILLEAAGWGVVGLAAPPNAAPLPGSLIGLDRSGCLQGAFVYAAGNAIFARVTLEGLVRLLGLSRRALLFACGAGGGLVGLAAAAGLFAIAEAGTSAVAMPLMQSAALLHPMAGAAHRLVLAAAAYTTAVAAAAALAGLLSASRLAGPLRGPAGSAAGAALAVVSTLPLAREGFVETVHTLYPLAGWTALVALALRWGFAMSLWRRLY